MELAWVSLGFFLGLVVDTIWWHTQINKYEKGLSFMEHFHASLILIIIFILTNIALLIGVSIALLAAEWSEPFCYGEKHPFAIGSGHCFVSAMIGLSLVLIIALLII